VKVPSFFCLVVVRAAAESAGIEDACRKRKAFEEWGQAIHLRLEGIKARRSATIRIALAASFSCAVHKEQHRTEKIMSPIAPVIPEDVDAATGSTLSQLEVKPGREPIGHSPDVVGVKRALLVGSTARSPRNGLAAARSCNRPSMDRRSQVRQLRGRQYCSAGCEQSVRNLPLPSPPARISPLHE
jgi:hypothetical protein